MQQRPSDEHCAANITTQMASQSDGERRSSRTARLLPTQEPNFQVGAHEEVWQRSLDPSLNLDWPTWPSVEHYNMLANLASCQLPRCLDSGTNSTVPRVTDVTSSWTETPPSILDDAPQKFSLPKRDVAGLQTAPRIYLESTEELRYMETFVTDVAAWMDCFHKEQYFSQNVPLKALKVPMLLNGLLACGAAHLSLCDDAFAEAAQSYYDSASSQLLLTLHDKKRNLTECATTSVVLSTYMAMVNRSDRRMHGAGSRALIKECEWDANSTGAGAACFWLNVGLEVLDCLATVRCTTWDPDTWRVNLIFDDVDEGDSEQDPDDTIWLYRVLYILARIANLRALPPLGPEFSPHAQHMEESSRFGEWQQLKCLSDKWDNACPRAMHPVAYAATTITKPPSCFPKIWLVLYSPKQHSC